MKGGDAWGIILKMGNYRNFTLTTYFTAHATAHITREELEKQLSFMERHMRLDKVYLEPFRGEFATHEQVEMCREVFEAHGVKVAGGLTTVIPTPEGDEPKARLFNTFCYNDPKMRGRLKEVCTFLGRHFDEFIIDDFFFTNCTCADCVREKNAFNAARGITDGSWQAYRLDLCRRVSEEDIIGPAKAANPNCKITIKYPNWAESYQETGYNPAEQRRIFDMIYTGTETRDPVNTDQHLPRYLSFSLMTYFENMWPGHNGGGWFDNFSMHVTEHYLEQAYLTAFSRPKELMMFCFQSLYNNMVTPALGFQLDKLDEILDHAGSPVGISCYLPDNSQGEDNIQDFLGMNGFPIVCTPYFPENAPALLLTRAAAFDPDILEKLERYVACGGNALVTTGFHEAMKDRGIYSLSSIRMRGRSITANRFRVESESPAGRPSFDFPYSAQEISIPVAEFRNNATWAVVKALHDEESYGLLLKDTYGKGCLWTIAVPDAFPDLYRLPESAVSRIRQAFPVRGIWLEGPTRVSLFIYDNDSFILYPYVMDNAQDQTVRVHVSGAKALTLPAGIPALKGRRIEPLCVKDGEAVFELPAVPGEYTIFKIER